MQTAINNLPIIQNKDLLYPELSYKVIEAIFDVELNLIKVFAFSFGPEAP